MKTVVITGSARGLGFEMAKVFNLIGKIDKEHINVKNRNMLIQA